MVSFRMIFRNLFTIFGVLETELNMFLALHYKSIFFFFDHSRKVLKDTFE